MPFKPPAWYRHRGYRHFDRPISVAEAERLVTSADAVATHAFWPFIGYTKVTPRYKSDEGKVVAKERSIAYASHVDSLIYAYYSDLLSVLYERELAARGLTGVVLAYRRFPGRKSNIHFAKEAFDEIAAAAPCEAIALDIESFFDRLQHPRLKAMWLSVLGQERLPDDHYAVFKAVTTFAKVDRDRFAEVLGIDATVGRPTEPLCDVAKFRSVIRADRTLVEKNGSGRGIPQGSPMSGLLANIYMLEVDVACNDGMRALGGTYRRYSDDILLTCPPGTGADAKALLARNLDAAGQTVAEGKTSEVAFRREDGLVKSSKPLQYLGFLYDGQSRIVRSQTLARLHRKMIHAVRCAVRDAERSARRGASARVWRRTLYERYSHLGKDRTYFRYYRKALVVMEDDALRAQHRRLWRRLQELLRGKTGAKTRRHRRRKSSAEKPPAPPPVVPG